MAQGTSELPPVPERPRDARAHQARCSTSQKLQKNIKVSHWVKPFVPVATALFCKNTSSPQNDYTQGFNVLKQSENMVKSGIIRFPQSKAGEG